MEPEKDNHSVNKNIALKRKVKNVGWNANNKDEQIISAKFESENLHKVNKQQQKQLGYKKLSEMSSKYAINMNVELGSGFASIVYLGQNINTQELICVKIIDYIVLGGQKQKQFLKRQIKYLKSFECNFIVKIFDVYESLSFCYLIMQYCEGGDLYKFLLMNPPLPIGLIHSIMNQICLGLIEMKKKQLIHRDIKTENIFLGQNFNVKIGDLGFCTELHHQHTSINAGSPIYMSPQLLSHQPFSFQSDIYALGIIWFELLHQHAPWEANSEAELLNNKISIPLQFIRQDLLPKDQVFIRKCLETNPQERCTIEELIQYFVELGNQKTQEKK